MTILPFQPQYRHYFEELNKAWLNRYFRVEPIDEKVLSNPEEYILRPGGSVLFAEQEGKIIGTVALRLLEPGVYELTKMAVDENHQGSGAGKLLCNSAITEAIKLNAKKLILYSQTSLKPAIGIYRSYGFIEVPLEKGTYERADIKMELDLSGNEGWFDRAFDFTGKHSELNDICLRLKEAPHAVRGILEQASPELQQIKPGGKWSVKEHLGHLSLLEPLWRTRFNDIMLKKEQLSPADLSNSATDEAKFNDYAAEDLLSRFTEERRQTLVLLDELKDGPHENSSLHPRLGKQMRIIDLAFFVAEHDKHHTDRIRRIVSSMGIEERV